VNLLRVGLLLPLLASTLPAAQWDPVVPADLAPNAARIDPAAPAETVFRRIEVDDRDFPEYRAVTAYNRYRIFDPERATDLTRLSYQSVEFNGANSGDFDFRVRLTEPDGTTRELGAEALRERTVSREGGGEKSWLQRLFTTSGLQVTEKFLVVPGIRPGAILDVRTVFRSHNLQQNWVLTATLQQFQIPIRTLVFRYRAAKDADWQSHAFLLNAESNHATMVSDPKGLSISVTAQNLPALYQEPFAVPLPNYALTFISAYHPRRTTLITHHSVGKDYQVNPNTDPWAHYATRIYMFETDRTASVTLGIKTLALSLTGHVDSELTKAQIIHRFVQELYQRYSAAPHPHTDTLAYNRVDSELQLVDFEKFPELAFGTQDFIFLEVALDQAAGLEAQTVLLPNLSQIRFDPHMVADNFLTGMAARVRADGQWHFSDPADANGFAFDVLPWELMGQVGLVVRPEKQEFFPVPPTPASASLLKITGSFELSADGRLTGNGVQTFTGQLSAVKRNATRGMTALETERFFATALQDDLKGAKVKVTDVEGREEASAPIKVRFTADWPDFAVATKSRLIFHPAIFHFQQSLPITAEVRHSNFQFPFRWSARDETIIRLPAGFEMESKRQPAPMPGEVLSYRCEIAQEKVSKRLHFDRDFVSNLVTAQAKANDVLLQIYRTIAQADQFELVLRKTALDAAEKDDAAP
jgi:hypothetical protein